jgi:hypothetical protein
MPKLHIREEAKRYFRTWEGVFATMLMAFCAGLAIAGLCGFDIVFIDIQL